MVSIYTLSDPITGQVRYVGKTKADLRRRLAQHLLPSNLRKNTHKNAWLKSLNALPLLEVVEEVAPELADDAERFWITQFRAWGFKLTNLTEGGDGGTGYKHSSASRQKRSDALKGRPVPWASLWVRTPEYRERLSRARTGMKFTDQHRRSMELARPGRPVVDDLGNVYGSIGIAARAIGVDRAHVRRVVQGKKRSACGRIFRYKDCV